MHTYRDLAVIVHTQIQPLDWCNILLKCKTKPPWHVDEAWCNLLHCSHCFNLLDFDHATLKSIERHLLRFKPSWQPHQVPTVKFLSNPNYVWIRLQIHISVNYFFFSDLMNLKLDQVGSNLNLPTLLAK